MTAFDEALKFTLGPSIEGGVSNDKADRGGLTNRGVTQRTYDAWRRSQGQAFRPVTLITDDEVRAIYLRLYWVAAHCDELPARLGMCVFDAAVNHGPTRATRLLQVALGVSDDGQFGPTTRRAVQLAAEGPTIALYLAARQDFYDDIVENDPTQVRFRNGWHNRVVALGAALESVWGTTA